MTIATNVHSAILAGLYEVLVAPCHHYFVAQYQHRTLTLISDVPLPPRIVLTIFLTDDGVGAYGDVIMLVLPYEYPRLVERLQATVDRVYP